MKLTITQKIIFFIEGFLSCIAIVIVLGLLQAPVDTDNIIMMLGLHLIGLAIASVLVFLPFKKYSKVAPEETKIAFLSFSLGFLIPSLIIWKVLSSISFF